MDIQIKKGLLSVCILYTISKSESYGYKIIDDMKELIPVSESALYPILKRFTKRGYLISRSNIYNGKLRKYYKITDLGLKKLNSYKNDLSVVQRILGKIDIKDQL